MVRFSYEQGYYEALVDITPHELAYQSTEYVDGWAAGKEALEQVENSVLTALKNYHIIQIGKRDRLEQSRLEKLESEIAEKAAAQQRAKKQAYDIMKNNGVKIPPDLEHEIRVSNLLKRND